MTRIAAALLLVLTPAVAVPAVEAGSTQSRVNEILATVREQGDRTPRGLFDELGTIGTPQAFAALEKSLDELDRLWSKRAVFHAMRFFLANETLGPKALNTVKRYSRSNKTTDARAAAGALAGFGPRAYGALFDVARGARDDIARAHAVRGLVPELASRANAASLEIILDGWITPASGSRGDGIDLLHVFQRPDDFDRMARYLASRKALHTRQLLILVAMESYPRGENIELDEGVDRVLTRGAQAKDPVLRYRALRAMDARGGTSSMRLVEQLADDRDPTVRRAALEILMGAGVRGFDPLELAGDRDEISRQAAAVGLAEDGSAASIEALHALLGDENPTVRAAAIHQVGRRRARSSIPELIVRLDVETGRLKRDAWYILTMITGMDLGLRVGAWQTFWDKEGETFVVPSHEAALQASEERAGRKEAGDTRVAFYGIDVISTRLAFVVDTSGSMKEVAYAGKRRLEIAKDQLRQTLLRIGDGVLFNVVPFAGAARPMEEGLIEMDDVERENAALFIELLRPGGGTNIHDGLAAAFDDDRIDTIYLLSDGAATAGEIINATALRDEVARWNSVRGVRIHCIAVGQDHELLKGLAADSGGVYVRVE